MSQSLDPFQTTYLDLANSTGSQAGITTQQLASALDNSDLAGLSYNTLLQNLAKDLPNVMQGQSMTSPFASTGCVLTRTAAYTTVAASPFIWDTFVSGTQSNYFNQGTVSGISAVPGFYLVSVSIGGYPANSIVGNLTPYVNGAATQSAFAGTMQPQLGDTPDATGAATIATVLVQVASPCVLCYVPLTASAVTVNNRNQTRFSAVRVA